MFRGFISVDIGDALKVEELINQLESVDADLKFVETENIHLTLKFLGDTNDDLVTKIKGVMEESVKGIGPFTIKFKGAGVFPSPKYLRVVWVGIEDPSKLETIAKSLDEKLVPLGFRRDEHGFSPHVTIARVKSAKNKDKVNAIVDKNANYEYNDFKVTELKLKKSVLSPKGPTYSTIETVKL